MQLWDYSHRKDYQFLLTCRINIVLKIFLIIFDYFQQNGNCINPTPIQSIRLFRKLFCTKFFLNNENCAADFSDMFSQYHNLQESHEERKLLTSYQKIYL